MTTITDRLKRWFQGPTSPKNYATREAEAAAARWRAHNARAQAEGCKCGKPATHVRWVSGTVGGVPAGVFTCAEHINVNHWDHNGDGTWVPVAEYTEKDLAWMSDPQPLTHAPEDDA